MILTKQQLEFKALGLIEIVKTRQKIEDTTVELKRDWPNDTAKAARGIAAISNASRGAPVIWLIGVDEKSGEIPGTSPEEYANWWPKVISHFEGRVVPELIEHIAIPWNAVLVTALYFLTDRAPYVVLNPAYGTAPGGPVEREVPWREGNSTRSAKRADLLRLLVAKAAVPEIERLSARLCYWRGIDQREKWELEFTLYFTPATSTPVYLPRHKWLCAVVSRSESFGLYITPGAVSRRELECTSNQVSIFAPTGVYFKAECSRAFTEVEPPSRAGVVCRFGIAGDDAMTSCEFRFDVMEEVQDNRQFSRAWNWRPDQTPS